MFNVPCFALVRIALLVTCVSIAACGSLPKRSPPTSAAAVGDFAATSLGRVAAASMPARASSGFRLLPHSGQAFEARAELIARAELTIDAQYYFVAGDVSGQAFLHGLESAAARGVRVRLLVDDLHTAEIDPLLARMSRRPHMEVRLFNPFCCARGNLVTRFAASLLDVRRLDHRMHNKLLVVDRRLAIAGGRNVADEYFGRNEEHDFVDVDALMAGDIVAQLASVFERYWSSDATWAAQDIFPATSAQERGADAPSHGGLLIDRLPEDVLGQRSVGLQLASGRIDLVGGTAYAFADSPSKALGDDDEYLQETSVLTRARETILTAQSEVVIATPYLIPRARGMAMVANLQARGVRLQVLTNGAGSNDSLFAYAGYARYRRPMLTQGVELHEMTATASATNRSTPFNPATPDDSRKSPTKRLHAKAFVVDKQTVFIGSTNFDPRSSDKNTELGILVESEQLADQMIKVIDANCRDGASRVRFDLQRSSTLQWVVDDGISSQRVLDGEPGLSLLDQLQELLLFPWVPESLL